MGDALADGCRRMSVKRYNIKPYHFHKDPVEMGYVTELADDGDFCFADTVEKIIAERDRLREELHTAKTDRAGWAARSKADFDRIGAALEPVRRKRPTGEPACSDGEAVEELVAECDRLREARDE